MKNQDKTKDFFTKNFWVLKPEGDFLSTYNIYLNVLREKHDQVDGKKFTPEDLVKRYKNYLQYKKKKSKEFIQGGHTPEKAIREFLIEEMYQSDFKEIIEAIPERDDYLFGEGFL